MYYFNEVDGDSYQRIDRIDDKYIYFYRKFDGSKPSDPIVSDSVVYSVFIENAKQARLRPYNAEEMKALVGKVLKHSTGCYLVTAFENRGNQVKIESVWRGASELVELWTQLDDSPCGKLEHLNEKGEWVE